jgi:MFS family permease
MCCRRRGRGGNPAAAPSILIPSISNFAIQYNMQAASIALPLLQAHPFYAPPAWVHFVALGAVFAGATLGMFTMGYLGDLLGRQRAMVCTMAIQVAGALGSAALSVGGATSTYGLFCFWRLLLGVGVGGMYPLSASHASESYSGGDGGGAGGVASRVGKSFFWQTPGTMAPYICALLLVYIVGERQCPYFDDHQSCAGDLNATVDPRSAVRGRTCEWELDRDLCVFSSTASTFWPRFGFRAILAAGAIPALVVLCSAVRETAGARRPRTASAPPQPERTRTAAAGRGVAAAGRSDDDAGGGGGGGGGSSSPLAVLGADAHLRRTLFGTASTWFLFDVAYYGTGVFLPSILIDLFGRGESIRTVCVCASSWSRSTPWVD